MKSLLFFCLFAIHGTLALAAAQAPTDAPAPHVHHDGMQMPQQDAPAAAAPSLDHAMHATPALFGAYPMSREASGTSWQPDSARHDGIHGMTGDWNTMLHGFANLVVDHQRGPRGATDTFSQSMLMLMAQRQAGPGTLGLRGMFSLDAAMGKRGYPELFQTGETADGATPLIDHQHPHDLVMELAATWSMPLSDHSSVFAYAGLPGEPALGPAAYMHRLSAMDNPEAPITHHWLDSTHISYGVTTLGAVLRNWKLEASAFHGREPDQFRYNIETGPLDSHSVRLSWNPMPDWSAQVSYGHLHSPEGLAPDIDVARSTASVTHNLRLGSGGDQVQSTFAWGRNRPSQGRTTSGFLAESAYAFARRHTVFGRIERVDKNELFFEDVPLHDRSFKINKASLGYVYDMPVASHVKLGIGGMLGAFAIPGDLKPVYGAHPDAALVFLRLKLE